MRFPGSKILFYFSNGSTNLCRYVAKPQELVNTMHCFAMLDMMPGVGRCKSNPVDPWLESAWFQPLDL
jgi:hypothetical protein